MSPAPSFIHTGSEITPFWRRIPKFFLFPFYPGPLLYSLFLTALAAPIAFLHPLLIVPLILGIFILAMGYALRIMDLTALGYLKPSEYDSAVTAHRGGLTLKLLGIYFLWGSVIGWTTWVNPTLGEGVSYFFSFATSASTMVLVVSGSFFQGLNPVRWIGVMWVLGKSYLILFLFQSMLSTGVILARPVLEPLLGNGGGWHVFPVLCYVIVYFLLVSFNMMGYCLYQHHHELGYGVRVSFEEAEGKNRSGSGNAQVHQHDPIGEEIGNMLAAGNMKGAIDLAYEQQRNEPGNIVVQERYHKLLLLRDKPAATLAHGKRFITLLLSRDQGLKAFEVFKTCRELQADFLPENPGEIFKLAQLAKGAREYDLALGLVKGFDKRYPNHPDVPGVYFMTAHMLSEHFKRDDLANLIFRNMVEKFPDHPLSTQAKHAIEVMRRMQQVTQPMTTLN